MRKRKRDTEIFSLSFLDCICCGFGAVLLLFVLTVGKKSDTLIVVKAKIQEIVGNMENDISKKDKELEALKLSLATQRKMNTETDNVLDEKKKMQTKLEDDFALILAQLASMEEALGKLLKDKDNIPMQEEEPPIPIVNEVRRQYLTGFDIQGDNVVFLIEASGGMTADTPEEAVNFIDADDEKKRTSPKWTRVKKGMRWLIANLKPESNYKIIFFNNEITPLETGYGTEWFNPSDKETTKRVIEELDKFVPEEGANLERAFDRVDELSVTPDRIVLIVDGLPTLADSYTTGSVTDDHDRINMFRVAKKALTLNVPVNVLLYPMKGDPASAVHFWRLADDQGGAMVCPSESWPNT